MVRLQQRLIHPGTGQAIDRDQVRKGFPIDAEHFVLLHETELDGLAPADERKIEIDHFIPKPAISLEWFDRPYYLGPSPDDEREYHSLATVLATRERCGTCVG